MSGRFDGALVGNTDAIDLRVEEPRDILSMKPKKQPALVNIGNDLPPKQRSERQGKAAVCYFEGECVQEEDDEEEDIVSGEDDDRNDDYSLVSLPHTPQGLSSIGSNRHCVVGRDPQAPANKNEIN